MLDYFKILPSHTGFARPRASMELWSAQLDAEYGDELFVDFVQLSRPSLRKALCVALVITALGWDWWDAHPTTAERIEGLTDKRAWERSNHTFNFDARMDPERAGSLLRDLVRFSQTGQAWPGWSQHDDSDDEWEPHEPHFRGVKDLQELEQLAGPIGRAANGWLDMYWTLLAVAERGVFVAYCM